MPHLDDVINVRIVFKNGVETVQSVQIQTVIDYLEIGVKVVGTSYNLELVKNGQFQQNIANGIMSPDFLTPLIDKFKIEMPEWSKPPFEFQIFGTKDTVFDLNSAKINKEILLDLHNEPVPPQPPIIIPPPSHPPTPPPVIPPPSPPPDPIVYTQNDIGISEGLFLENGFVKGNVSYILNPSADPRITEAQAVLEINDPTGKGIKVKENDLHFSKTERDEIINYIEGTKGETKVTIKIIVFAKTAFPQRMSFVTERELGEVVPPPTEKFCKECNVWVPIFTPCPTCGDPIPPPVPPTPIILPKNDIFSKIAGAGALLLTAILLGSSRK